MVDHEFIALDIFDDNDKLIGTIYVTKNENFGKALKKFGLGKLGCLSLEPLSGKFRDDHLLFNQYTFGGLSRESFNSNMAVEFMIEVFRGPSNIFHTRAYGCELGMIEVVLCQGELEFAKKSKHFKLQTTLSDIANHFNVPCLVSKWSGEELYNSYIEREKLNSQGMELYNLDNPRATLYSLFKHIKKNSVRIIGTQCKTKTTNEDTHVDPQKNKLKEHADLSSAIARYLLSSKQ